MTAQLTDQVAATLVLDASRKTASPWRSRLLRLASVTAAIGLWQLLTAGKVRFLLRFDTLPTVTQVAHALTRRLHTYEYWLDLAQSLLRILTGFGIAAVIGVATGVLLGRSRGAAVRIAALALIALALANPSFTREDREPLSSVAVVVVDKSPSQNFGDRTKQTEQAREALVNELKKIRGLDVRVVEAGQADGETDGTKLFGALSSALSDVPVDRVAGAFA